MISAISHSAPAHHAYQANATSQTSSVKSSAPASREAASAPSDTPSVSASSSAAQRSSSAVVAALYELSKA